MSKGLAVGSPAGGQKEPTWRTSWSDEVAEFMFCKNCGEERTGIDAYGLCAECGEFPSASGDLLHELIAEVTLDGLNEPRAAKLADLGQVAVAQYLALHAEVARALGGAEVLDEPDGDFALYRLPVAEVRRIGALLENLGAPQGT